MVLQEKNLSQLIPSLQSVLSHLCSFVLLLWLSLTLCSSSYFKYCQEWLIFYSNSNCRLNSCRSHQTHPLTHFYVRYVVTSHAVCEGSCWWLQLYRTRACPHLWPFLVFQGRSFTEVAVCVKVNPADDRFVACGDTGLPGGIFLIKCDGRFKAEWLPVGGY